MIALGFVLGLVGTLFSFAASYGIIRLGTASLKRQESPGLGAVLIVIAFLAKLPILVAVGLAAQRIGPTCMNGFLTGLGLAYLLLTGYGIVDGQQKAAAADPSRYVVIEDEPEEKPEFDD